MTTTDIEKLLKIPYGTIWNHIRLGNIEKPTAKHGNALLWSNAQVKSIRKYFEGRKDGV